MKAETQPGALVTLTEAAPMLHPPVSRQGAHGIADRDEDFPAPVCTVSGGKTTLFWRRDIERYAERQRAREAAAAAAA